MPGYNRSEIIKLLEGRKQFKEYNGEITTKNPKFKELVDIYNSRVKIVQDTKFTALVDTAVTKMENLQNSQEGFALIQKNLLDSINEYQTITHSELTKQTAETNNKISEFENKVKANEIRLKKLKQQKKLTPEEQKELTDLKKASLDAKAQKELKNFKKTANKAQGKLKETKSQASKLKTAAQKGGGVATLKSLCNAVWNRNKRTGVLGVLDNAHTFISSTIKGSDKIKTKDIQPVIDSLAKKDYHKGFEESYSRINDVASFDSGKIADNMSIAVTKLKAEAKTFSDQTNQKIGNIKSQLTIENIKNFGISFAFKKLGEAKSIAKKREKDLKAILPACKAYCSCESNDSKIMEALTTIAQCIFLFETLKCSANSTAISSSGAGYNDDPLWISLSCVSALAALGCLVGTIPLVMAVGPLGGLLLIGVAVFAFLAYTFHSIA